MSSEKKPQPVCLPDKFHQFAVTSSDYSRPFLAGCYPTLEAAVRAQGGKPEKWDVFVRYSTHEATIEALRAERDEAIRRGEDQWTGWVREEVARKAAEARVAQLEAALGDGLKELDRSQRPSFAWQRRARALLSDGGR